MDRSRTAVRIITMAAIAGILLMRPVGVCPCSAAARAEDPAVGHSEARPGATTFDLNYHGLDAPDDPLSYRAYWGFGARGQPDSAFVRAVKKRVRECTPVYNPELRGAEWSVVELEDGKPAAFWFDVNGDGKLSENERSLPVPPSGGFRYPYGFITSDFEIRTEDGREVPFRAMLVGMPRGSASISYMWTPSCVLEGQAVLDGEAMRLILYGQGFSGSFTEFGRCSFALIPAGRKLEGYLPRSTLSSLINHNGTFYRLRFAGAHERDNTLRVILEKDTRPTGRMTMRLAGKKIEKSRLSNVGIQGATDTTVRFYVGDTQSPLPTMRYRLSSAYAHYGVDSDSQWRVNFTNGPEFTVEASQTTEIDLGTPVLSVRAIDERDRYNNDAQERSTFPNSKAIYLTPQIRGKAGEIYMRFSRTQDATGNYTDAKPHYTILDSDGQQVVSGDMEYG